MSVDSTTSTPSQDGTVIRGILTGLAPVALLAVLGALTVLATTLARALTNGEPFLTQQPVLVYTFGVGVLVAFGAWIAGCRWALRRARTWEQKGAPRLAAATLWTIGVSAIIVLLPVLLAVLIPQHPAHPAP
jgi:high-affinity nickel permease